jgi:hypothetical protein
MKLIFKIAACQHGWPEECGQPAEYDLPTVSGQWANLCGPHRALDCLPSADAVGYRLTPDANHPDLRENQTLHYTVREANRASLMQGPA